MDTTNDTQRADDFIRVSPLEFAAGWVSGYVDESNWHVEVVHPIVALEDVLRPALAVQPCVLGFSGGRDSSAILAIAVRLARREGYPLPVPSTKRYPEVPESDESQWQELVIRHLGITEWIRHEIHEEVELLGPAAQASLRRFGPLWPATLHNRGPSIATARGGTYIDGEGGDEILGDFRITPVTQLIRRERRLNWDATRKSLYALAPQLARRRAAMRRVSQTTNRPWLQPHVLEWYVRQMIEDEAARPLLYPAAVHRMATRRAVAVAIHNLDTMGHHLGVTYLHPLLDRRFVRALGAWGGRLGHSSRTSTMRALFHDVLPDALLAREQKAYFNAAYAGSLTREFLREWDGAGLDEAYVDVDALRRTWNEPSIHGGTFQLIHAAWWFRHGAPRQPSSDVPGD